MEQVDLAPGLVSQSEANLQDLLQCREVQDLRFLSEGLVRLLDECDSVFLDTSVLLNGTFTFRVSPNWMKSYFNKRGEFNLHSLSSVHLAYERGRDGRIDLDELYMVIGEDILRGDLSLQIFEEAFKCRNVRLAIQVFGEASRNYSLARRQVAYEEGRVDRLYRYPRNLHTNKKKRRNWDVRVRSIKELALGRAGRLDPNLIKCIKLNLDRLSGILSFAQLNNRVVEDSGIYPIDVQYSDSLVIDGAMQYPGVVGIVTQDMKFGGKVREVVRERISRKLNVPRVYLLTGFRNLETYEISRI